MRVNPIQQRNAQILRECRVIGDAAKVAQRHGLTRLEVLRIIHAGNLSTEVNKASEYAQAVMQAGEVVYAIPAKHLQTGHGAMSVIEAIQAAIAASRGDGNVMIAVAVIPVEEVVATEPLTHPKAVAASLQAKAINRNSEIA